MQGLLIGIKTIRDLFFEARFSYGQVFRAMA